jgi:hypothetical protein
MNDLIPTEAQRHREAVEKAEEFFDRNPTLIRQLRDVEIKFTIFHHAEALLNAAKFFIKNLGDCEEALVNAQEEIQMHEAADYPEVPHPDPE